MIKRKRFYLHDVAACMGVEVSRLRILCKYWEVAAHGVHEFEDVKGQRAEVGYRGREWRKLHSRGRNIQHTEQTGWILHSSA